MNDQILGNSLEQRKLADSYYMEGSDESLNLASVWYQTAAVQGDSQAEYMLGLMYYQGRGFRKDYDSAYRWFIKSCKNGNKNAQYTMGFMLQKGVGLKKSQKKAFEQFYMSAEQGVPEAQHMLGEVYCSGRGVEQDFSKSLYWYSVAANNGFHESVRCIGVMYAKGQGVKQSDDQAKIWFRLASGMGNKSAQRVLLYPERWPFETYTQPDVKKPQCSKIENIISNHTLKEDVSDENRPKFEELYSLENMSREKFLLAYFRYNHIRYIDVRYNNGSIWVVDRPGVKEQLDRLKKYGFYFMFTKNGSHTSDHKPAFWLPNRYLE